MIGRPFANSTMSALAGLLVRIFFRQLEVTGAEHIPDSGPVLIVANHQNGLVDGLVLIAALGRYPRFVGKATLWKILPLRPFLSLAGVVPIHRARDSGKTDDGLSLAERRRANDATFARCRHLLAEGGMVALFPEGISHDEYRLQTLRTGAARLALGALDDDAVEGLVIVAAGLVYDDKSRFRSRALVRVGLPRLAKELAETSEPASSVAVHGLTEVIAADLRAVAPDFATADLARRCLQIAEIVCSDVPSGASVLSARGAVAASLASLSAESANEGAFEHLWSETLAYRRNLAFAGLADAQVVFAPRGRLGATLTWSTLKIILATPIAAIGVLIHLMPYSIIKVVGRIPGNVGMRATVKLLGCFTLFSTTYLLLAVKVASRRGLRAACLAFVAAPLSGWVALISSERLVSMGGLLRSIEALRSSGQRLSSLLATRRRIVSDAYDLIDRSVTREGPSLSEGALPRSDN